MTKRPEKAAGETKRSRPKLDDLIVWLCTERGVGRSLSPMIVAKSFAEGRKGDEAKPSHWARDVRSAAIGLSRAGKISIFRKGKAVEGDDLKALKGVYRIGLPRPDGGVDLDDEADEG